MSDVAPTEIGRRSSEKLYSEQLYREEQEVQTSNGAKVAGFVESGLGIAEIKAAPRPWRVGSGQRASEEADVAACPWRVQPRRKQRRRAGVVQETGLDTAGVVEEAAS